jgi:UDP-N-acetylmuramoyl-tripeptide--D-alanyl-D-alanine ligase
MVRATLQQIGRATGATLVAGDPAREVCGVAVDSRAVGPNMLFVAFPGEHVDGNDFAPAALRAGAAAVVLTRPATPELLDAAAKTGAGVLVCADPAHFLELFASWWRDKLNCVVVGVTGSSGKSTTKEMVAAVLSAKYRTHATRGNFNSTIGAPLTVLGCPLDAEALVVEMGMNDRHEIEAICRAARPHIGIVTNVGVAHVGILGSRANIARAKAELVEALPAFDPAAEVPTGVLLWGQDDFTPWIRDEVAAPRGVRVLTFGTAPDDDSSCTDAALDAAGCARGRAVLPSGAELDLALSLPGTHNVLDALAAAAVGDLLGVDPAAAADALRGVAPLGSRQRVEASPNGFTVFDDAYNANTDSMRRAVDVLCTLEGTRRVACLGDMGELGDEAPRHHALVGAYVAAKPVDVLVCAGPLSAAMADAAELMGMGAGRVLRVADAAEATEALRGLLRPGDVVLIKASRSTGLDQCAKAVMEPWA